MMTKKKVDYLKLAKKWGKKKVSFSTILIVVVIVLIVGLFVVPNLTRKDAPQNIVSENTLEKIVKTSKLSTYKTVYKGIVPVMNEKKPEKVDYYISYEATVKAGLDFEEINIVKNDETKKIIVDLPEISILEPIVKENLDYIIINKKVDENGLFAEALKLAKQDVSSESKKQSALLSYAEKNAENLITGLLSPFVEQLDGYEIVFK